MSQRHEFVLLASQDRANIRELCHRFGISSATAYKWLNRFASQGVAGLEELSRRPHHSPARTVSEMEQAVVALRQKHPAWGGRKLRQRLCDLGHRVVPSASTITAILRRHQLLDPQESAKRQTPLRFERDAPNELWQMDFKGDFKLPRGRCFPLTIIDDHSRFALAIRACARTTALLTKQALIPVFRRYGLPQRITCDNGSPWGARNSVYTEFSVWLLHLGINVSHSRPYHPQTQGKDERFHRTLAAEVLRYQNCGSLADWQQQFDLWRDIYNTERPHEALAMKVPASRYRPSERPFPEQLPAIEYGPTDIVRKVRGYGHIMYRGLEYHVGVGFHGLPVALRATTTDGILDVFFCQHRIKQLILR
jgi:transposase InsO family protein